MIKIPTNIFSSESINDASYEEIISHIIYIIKESELKIKKYEIIQ
jgi:hypothetical protein